MATKHIIAIGGRVLVPESRNFGFEQYILDVSTRPKPRVCFLPTATGDDPAYIARFYESYAQLDCRPSHLSLFRRTPRDLKTFLLDFDVIHVGGGNTRSMLAVWQHWGIDAILRDAWQRGIVLTGSSAGMICWFEQALTDSVAGSLTTMNGLGFLAGSACPHYDGEAERRPTFHAMVGDGTLSAGYACDDGAALHFRETEVFAAIASRPNARAYRVEKSSSELIETGYAMQLLQPSA